MNTQATASPPSSPAPAAVRRPWLRRALSVFKLTYLLGASFLSVWIASFAPVGSPPLAAFVPPRAGFVVQVRDGAKLLETLTQSAAGGELYDDSDFETISQLNEKLSGWKNAQGLAHRLFPYRIETLFPVAGHEMLFAVIVPVAAHESQPPAGGKKKKDRSGEQRLLMTQLSGGRGHLLRIIAWFLHPRDAAIYDLGGGAMAIGYNGGCPVFSQQRLQRADAGPIPQDGARIARLEFYPPILQGRPTEAADLKATPIGPYLESIAESMARALARPPGVSEIVNAHETPREVELDFYLVPEGVEARGRIAGGVPELPKVTFDPSVELPTADKDQVRPYAEGLLPIDPRAAYLAYVTQQLAQSPPDPNRPNATRRLSGKQQRLVEKLAGLQDLDIDFDRDLFPLAGNSVRFRVDALPPEFSQMGYGLVRLSLPLDARKPETRSATKELVKLGWNVYGTSHPAPKDAKQPYVQEVSNGERENYVLVNGQGFAPTIAISNRSVSVTSDAGPSAFNQPPAQTPKAGEEKPAAYYIRLDGPRLAASVETIARSTFEGWEKDEGSQKFLANHPNAAAWIELDRKLSGLLGSFTLSLTPTERGCGEILLSWKPGTMKVPAASNVGTGTNAVPPPPPPGADDAPAPAPPD